MIHRTRPRSSALGPALLVSVLVIGGGCAFWFGLRAFRAHALENALAKTSEATSSTSEVQDLAHLSAIATLRDAAGDVGRATRTFTDETHATVDILVSLPAVDAAAYTYDVWLLKNGLADVVNIGSLLPRADGTWAGVLLAEPSTGVLDPALYSQIVIMAEPRDGNDAPSGVKMCTGSW